jgi:peptide/nickel transport system permease protein
VEGRSPWYFAYRRLRSNRVAIAALALFAAIVVFVLAAPLWADQVADTGPNETHTVEKIEVDGETREVVEVDGTPIGPVWLGAGGKFFLGADGRLGRDEMVRLMYGGRTTLLIGIGSALISVVLAVLLALLAGYHRGWVDTVISRGLDLLWAFPVLLLAIALGSSLAVGGLDLGPISISGGSLWVPLLVISLVYTTYIARPLRGEVLALREREFVEAAIAGGAGPLRVMLGELLPNLWSKIIVFFPLAAAFNMLLESALSFVGAGVQPPNSSWGTMIDSGFDLLYTTPLLTILPGAMITLTALSLNLLGDALRDALDPKSKVELEAHTGSFEPEGEVL